METFSALLTICAGNSPVPGAFPAQRPVTRSFDVSFDLHPHKPLSKQWWGWWYETLSCPLWRHGNEYATVTVLARLIIDARKTHSVWNNSNRTHINTLRPRQSGSHLPYNNFKVICFYENCCIFIKILLKFIPRGPINTIPALVQIIAWCRLGGKPLPEPMMISVLTYTCVTRPQ